MGHGPEAAAVMVQLRTAAHTLADVELAPERVLARLDRMAAGLISPFATCIYTVIDPATSSCVTAQAGHLPPVLVLADGETQVLELPPGLPLGLGAETFESTRISLPPGATLALYTDGLVESRAQPLDDGLEALQKALRTALADPAVPLERRLRGGHQGHAPARRGRHHPGPGPDPPVGPRRAPHQPHPRRAS